MTPHLFQIPLLPPIVVSQDQVNLMGLVFNVVLLVATFVAWKINATRFTGVAIGGVCIFVGYALAVKSTSMNVIDVLGLLYATFLGVIAIFLTIVVDVLTPFYTRTGKWIVLGLAIFSFLLTALFTAMSSSCPSVHDAVANFQCTR